MAIQLKSGLILLDGGQVANDPGCCCGIAFGPCTCNGLNTITIAVVDNFGFGNATGGNYSSTFSPTEFACSFAAKSALYDSGGGFAWRITAPIILSGGLLRVRLDWYDSTLGTSGVIHVPYGTSDSGPWRFERSPGNYIDAELVC